jgi:Glycosyl hydrolase family 79 C-terminal beta domain
MLTALTVAVVAAVAITAGPAGPVRAAGTTAAGTTQPGTIPAGTTQPGTTQPGTAPTTTIPTTSTPPPPPPVNIQIGHSPVGRPIAPSFVGLSIEFPAIRSYTGLDPTAINPVFVALVRNLAPGEPPVVRIGGNSTDATWLPARGVHPTPGIHSTITPRFLALVRNLASETRARLILGLNLKLNSASEIAAEAHAYLAGIGAQHIEALEIGNEPELYTISPWYTTPSGKSVYSRRRGFNFRTYTEEVSQYAAELKGNPLAGPATGNQAWLAKLPKVLRAEPELKVITYHRYPLIRCFTQPGDPNYPTIPNLLALRSSRGLLNGAVNEIDYAHRHGATFRLDELNSVACKGQPGVSNTFASALWVLDTLFSVARSGVDGVNIHTLPEAAYRLFTFTNVDGHWQAAVQPEYYGLLMFGQAAPPGARLLPVSPSATSDLRAWAARLTDGEVHVVLINDSPATDHSIQLTAPVGTGNTAVVERLTAPSADATSGVTLGGQSFGTETATGSLTGPVQQDHIQPVNGQYTIDLPASSAALVSLAPAAAGSRPGLRTAAPR